MESALDRLLTPDRTRVYPKMVAYGLCVTYLLQALLEGYDGRDYIAFYSAARIVLEDPTANPYLSPEFLRMQFTLSPEDEIDIARWIHPPVALLLYVPLALLPYRISLAVWLLLGVACWTAGHAWLRRALPEVRTPGMLKASFLFAPTVLWVAYGQSTGVVFLVLVVTYALLVQGREARAGAVLSLLAFKPQLALGLAIPLIVRFRWRALLAGVSGVALQVGLSYRLWPEQYALYLDALPHIVEVVRDPRGIGWGVHTLDSFWHQTVGGWAPGLARHLARGTTWAVLVALAAGWRRVPWDPATGAWQRAMASTLIAGWLLGLHLWTYDLALLALPWFIVRGVASPRVDPQRVLRVTAVVWVLCFLGPFANGILVQATHLAFGWSWGLPVTVPALLWAAWRVWPRRGGAGGG